jgi:pantoate--beta-alanine ligase
MATRLCKASENRRILVPTMGALHRGHAALIRRARQLSGPKGAVIVSIFVNPAQFAPTEDFTSYPRPFAADKRLCAQLGVDLLFHPTAKTMYPRGFSTYVEESSLSLPLCARSRPGHFRGVCTVVLKLFEIIQPDAAVFGLKDLQQYMVIRRMVRDLNIPVRVAPVQTVREADGLALSSRNQYLSAEERAQAPVLRQALLEAKAAFQRGETSAARLRQRILRKIATAPLARVDYVDVVEAESLRAVRTAASGTLLALAVFFGGTRLIDNLWLRS